jgi:hypothetical protein
MEACVTCRFFVGVDEAAVAKAALAGGVLRGRCRRFPEELAKQPDQWCGEFEGKGKKS